MKFVVDDCMGAWVHGCMGAVPGDTQLSGSVILHYSSVCHDDVMNLGNGFLCSDSDWPSPTGVVFQTIPATFEFSIPLLHHAV